MICKFCGSDRTEPPICVALRNGYLVGVHCRIRAAREGRVSICCNWLGWQYCELCPVAEGLFKQPKIKTKGQ